MPSKATTKRSERHSLFSGFAALFGAPQRGQSNTGQLNGPGVGPQGGEINRNHHFYTLGIEDKCFGTLHKANCLEKQLFRLVPETGSKFSLNISRVVKLL